MPGQAKLTKAERQAQRKAERQAKRKAERQAARQAQREAARQAQSQAAASDPDNSSPQPRRSAVPQLPAEKQSADAARSQGGGDAGAPAAGGATTESQPISYWELPAAVRNQLPEMNISVLVFAERPADRFVLMDGQRLAEGDQLQDGLTLQEVRRDGAVMRFKMYRFLVSYG